MFNFSPFPKETDVTSTISWVAYLQISLLLSLSPLSLHPKFCFHGDVLGCFRFRGDGSRVRRHWDIHGVSPSCIKRLSWCAIVLDFLSQFVVTSSFDESIGPLAELFICVWVITQKCCLSFNVEYCAISPKRFIVVLRLAKNCLMLTYCISWPHNLLFTFTPAWPSRHTLGDCIVLIQCPRQKFIYC